MSVTGLQLIFTQNLRTFLAHGATAMEDSGGLKDDSRPENQSRDTMFVILYNSLYVNVPYKEGTEFLPSYKDSIPMHPPTTFSRFKYQLMRYR